MLEEEQQIKENYRKCASGQSNGMKIIPTKNVPKIKLPMLRDTFRGVGGSMAAKLACDIVVN